MAEYVARYPEVSVELDLTARVVDLVAEGFDVAIRAGNLTDSSLVARKVGQLPLIVVGSPDYVAHRGELKTPADLGETTIEVTGRLAADDFSFVRTAAISGAGLCLLPTVVCGSDIREGRLVRVLEEYEAVGGSVFVVYPSARQVPAKVAALRDLVAEVFERSNASSRKAGARPSRRR
jgi:DNA-binding transcriptional LysR family regulator